MANHTVLHVDCEKEDKEAWILSSRVAELTFEEWVIKTLNAAAINPRPQWALGLSDRATTALVLAGFTSKEQLRRAVADKYDFRALPNAGRKVEAEVIAWLE